MTEYYIWLLSVMGAANPRSIRLISRFGGVIQAYEALTSGETGFLKPHEAKNLTKASIDKSRELVEWCKRRNYGVVSIEDPDYPPQLKHIYNPPIVLFVEGDLKSVNDEIKVSVIGTRSPSDYSYKIADFLCADLAEANITVVSGLAIGLDKAAMTSALSRGGKVVGVLACGIDVEYPRGSRDFRRSVVENGGVCLSELTPREATRPAYFQSRNRLVSGLSLGTLIIEAGERSGCHITATHALAQNRDLFCVPPHDILDPRYFGVIRYLRDGAIPVFNRADIIREYLPEAYAKINEITANIEVSANTEISKTSENSETSEASASPANIDKSVNASKSPARKKSVKASAKTSEVEKTSETPKTSEKPEKSKPFEKAIIPQAPPKADYANLPPEQAAIVEALRKKKLSFDEIVKKKLCAPEKAYEILLDMELDGLIEKIAGDRYTVNS